MPGTRKSHEGFPLLLKRRMIDRATAEHSSSQEEEAISLTLVLSDQNGSYAYRSRKGQADSHFQACKLVINSRPWLGYRGFPLIPIRKHLDGGEVTSHVSYYSLGVVISCVAAVPLLFSARWTMEVPRL